MYSQYCKSATKNSGITQKASVISAWIQRRFQATNETASVPAINAAMPGMNIFISFTAVILFMPM